VGKFTIQPSVRVLVSAILGVGCGETPQKGPPPVTPPVNDGQDILRTDIVLNIDTLAGDATIEVLPYAGVVELNVEGLQVDAVQVAGEPVEWTIHQGLMVVDTGDTPTTLSVAYHFSERSMSTFDGWIPRLGVSFIWPHACGNLYPCNPDTRDGVVLGLTVQGVPENQTALAPADTVGEAPAYQIGLAMGNYQQIPLGETDAGTRISAWYPPEIASEADTRAGTAHLRDVVDFYERTYGPYSFGADMRSVVVDWGWDSYGGMEHHPYFHVAKWDVAIEEVHAHEAGHGWFGAGVRLECWEDFVLSEGTTTYITARALAEVGAPDVWDMYVDDFLIPICEGQDYNNRAWRDTCDVTDFTVDPLWSLATYMKGACFYGEVADLIGAEELDAILAEFYQTHHNQPARMQDMIDLLHARTRPDAAAAIEVLTEEWLLERACPENYADRCRVRD